MSKQDIREETKKAVDQFLFDGGVIVTCTNKVSKKKRVKKVKPLKTVVDIPCWVKQK